MSMNLYDKLKKEMREFIGEKEASDIDPDMLEYWYNAANKARAFGMKGLLADVINYKAEAVRCFQGRGTMGMGMMEINNEQIKIDEAVKALIQINRLDGYTGKADGKKKLKRKDYGDGFSVVEFPIEDHFPVRFTLYYHGKVLIENFGSLDYIELVLEGYKKLLAALEELEKKDDKQ